PLRRNGGRAEAVGRALRAVVLRGAGERREALTSPPPAPACLPPGPFAAPAQWLAPGGFPSGARQSPRAPGGLSIGLPVAHLGDRIGAIVHRSRRGTVAVSGGNHARQRVPMGGGPRRTLRV